MKESAVNREPCPEDILFADDTDSSGEAGSPADGEWGPENSEWEPAQEVGDLEGLITQGVPPLPPPPAEEERPRCLLPSLTEETPSPTKSDLTPPGFDPLGTTGPRDGVREALPTLRDAPVHHVRHQIPVRTTSWVLPGLVLLLGGALGFYIYAPLDNPVLGPIAIAFSVVGSLFLRVLLKG